LTGRFTQEGEVLQAIGIDLGTTKSVVAALRQGEPQPLLNRERSPFTPSVLAVDEAGNLLAGHQARDRLAAGPPHALPLPSLGGDLKAPVTFHGREYTPVELLAVFLARLREDAEAFLGEPVRRAVLTAPVSHDQGQVAALRTAAGLAGLFTLQVVRSPTAAALAYNVAPRGLKPPLGRAPRLVMVCDQGGGSLSVAALCLFRGALTVLGLAGQSWLGGNDLTEVIVAALIRRLQAQRGLLLDETLAARQQLRWRLRLLAEEAKVALSIVERASIPLTHQTTGLPVSIEEVLTRDQFDEMVRPRLEEAVDVAEQAVLQAGLSPHGIDAILPVGGATQVPLLATLLAGRFPKARLLRDVNPLLGPALGAALRAGMVAEVACPFCQRPNPLDAPLCRSCRAPLAGHARTSCARCFLPNDARRRACWKCGASLRSTALRHPGPPPASRPCPRCGALAPRRRRTCPACHALLLEAAPGRLRCGHCGLVLQAGVATCPGCGELVAPFVGEIASRSLGVELADGRLDVILPRGHSFPSPRPVYREFRTAGAGQQYLQVSLYEGDRPIACENRCCAELQLTLPAGLPPGSVVRVGFSLDRDGLLTAGAGLADDSRREVDLSLVAR
jgi:molecular chaperone DnaK (HSP70)